eukprot:3940047-Rhodomonas_salina.1
MAGLQAHSRAIEQLKASYVPVSLRMLCCLSHAQSHARYAIEQLKASYVPVSLRVLCCLSHAQVTP